MNQEPRRNKRRSAERQLADTEAPAAPRSGSLQGLQRSQPGCVLGRGRLPSVVL
jgi:hypothetical protein